MSFPQQAELEALAKKVPEGLNQDELNKLGELTAKKSEWLANQTKIVTDIVNLIKKDKVSLIELMKNNGYSKKDLQLTAIHFKLIEGDSVDSSDQPSSSNSVTKRIQKSGPVLFTFEKVGGKRSSIIRQDSTIPASPNESHIAFFLAKGKTKEKLMQLREDTPETESFLKSADGVKLVNAWVNWFDSKVKNFVAKHPEKVPAKA